MLVDELRRLPVAKHIHRRAVVAPRSPEHDEARSRSEPGAVRGRELGRDRFAGPANEWRADPAAELVPLLVVEPPDALAGWVEPARHPVSRAFDAIRDAAMPIHPAIPRVDLEASARVREVDEPVGIVTRPRRESEPRRAVTTLPGDLGRGNGLGDRHGARVYEAIRPCSASHMSSRVSYSGTMASRSSRPPSVGACPVPA